MALPQKLPLDLMQTKWASQLNPLLNNPIMNGLMLQNIALISGVNNVNHLLQRTQQGWFITDQTAAAEIYRSADFNKLTLQLTASAPTTISLWVF